MSTEQTVEEYLVRRMATLCSTTTSQPSQSEETIRLSHELDWLDIATPFDRVASVLGLGTLASQSTFADAPPSLRESREHRYSFPRWPHFDFVVLESKTGLAWGQQFLRCVKMPIPPIRGLADVTQWSHVASEVRVALGEPASHEGWPPWEHWTYQFDGRRFALCYVYGLLQKVAVVD